MKNSLIFGNENDFSFEVKDLDNGKFKIRLWCNGKILVPYQKKEKYDTFLKNIKRILTYILNEELFDLDFSSMSEIGIVNWIHSNELREKKRMRRFIKPLIIEKNMYSFWEN